LQLIENFAFGGSFAKEQSGDSGNDQQKRSDRKHRIKGQGRAHALGIVIYPVNGGGLEQV